MLDITAIKPGQRVTVRYAAPITWGKKTGNRFADMSVTRETTCCFTAAGEKTYANKANALGHELTGKEPYFRPAESIGPCVFHHKDDVNRLYIAGINHDYSYGQIFIGNKPASEQELAEMQEFFKVKSERERGLDFRVWKAENLVNAVL
jgi:hypothetical protein